MLLHRFYYFHAVVTELLRVCEYGNGAMTTESGENDAIKLRLMGVSGYAERATMFSF